MSQGNDLRDGLAPVLAMQPKVLAESAERRRHPRYPLRADATLHSDPSRPGARVTLTDISLGGCYVETAAICAVGSQVAVKFELGVLRISISGCVTTSHPMVGMGIAFDGTSPELQELIRQLAEGWNHTTASLPRAEATAPPSPPERRDDPAPVFAPVLLTPEQTYELARELVIWFERHGQLERRKFLELLQTAIAKPRLQR
jgi:hypothetical protein